MFAEASYRCRLWRLQAARRKNSRMHDRELKKLKRAKASSDEIDAILADYSFEDDVIENDLMLLRSRHLVATASGLFIPIPENDEISKAWVPAQDGSGRRHLTLEAQSDLAAEIRKERSGRSERFRLWLAGLTGLVGAATGLAALLLRGSGH